MRAGAPPVAVAARAYARGEVIWSERPLVALQAARSRGSVLACACCLARLGGADGHLAAAARRSGRVEAAAAPPSALPPLPAAPALGAPPARAAVTCARGCGELFCDASCAARADAHGHRLLCVGPLDEDHELYRFKCHALAANEDAYLLAAQLLARALCAVQDGASEADALAPLDALRCGPWWQAAALAEESAAVRAALRSQVEASWALLRAGLLRVLGGPSFSAQAPRCLSLDAYASAITAAALRGGEAVATTPLRAYIDALRLPRRVRKDAPERATALTALEQAAAEAAAAHAAEKAALRAGGGDSDSDSSESESEKYGDGDDDDGSASDDEGWGGAALRCADEGAAMRRVLAARRLLCPPLRCAALFVAAAATPHSCAPAAVLSYDDGASYGIDGDDDENEDGGCATAATSAAPLCATLRAARDVAPGEPLSRAWVDPAAPLQERDQALAALSLPPCECDRCVLERSACGAAPPLPYAAARSLAARATSQQRPRDAALAYSAALTAAPGDGDAAAGLAAARLHCADFRGAAEASRLGFATSPHHPELADAAAASAAFAGVAASPDDVAVAAHWASDAAWATVPAGRAALAALSAAPLLTPAQCADAVAEAEAAASVAGGWSTARHVAVPTTDVSLRQLPRTRAAFCSALARCVAPRLASMPSLRVPPGALRVHDAFLVRYDALQGQAALPRHSDQAQLSLTIALGGGGDPACFAGGGTRLRDADVVILPPPGHALLFASGLTHAGERITAGRRYIIAAFLWIDAPPPQRPLIVPAAPDDEDSSSGGESMSED